MCGLEFDLKHVMLVSAVQRVALQAVWSICILLLESSDPNVPDTLMNIDPLLGKFWMEIPVIKLHSLALVHKDPVAMPEDVI